MAEKKRKRPGRRAYLNDFRMGAGGQYSYMGTTYVYEGERPYKDEALRVGVLTGVIVSALIAIGVIPHPAMLGYNNFYVVPFFLFELVAVFVTVYGAVRMLTGGSRLRAYKYEATVKKLPNRLMITTVAALIMIPANIVYLCLNGFEGRPVASIAAILLHGAIAAAAQIMKRLIEREKWTAEMPEEPEEDKASEEEVFPPYEGEQSEREAPGK